MFWSRRVRIGSFTLLTLVLLLSPLLTQAQPDPLAAARAKMEELDSYAFTADIEQTLIPRPIPANIGQTEQRTDMRLTGDVTSPNQSEIHMRLEGAGPDAPPLTIIQEGNNYSLLKEGERTLIENPLGTAVPNGDFLSYLNAADNIQPAPSACPADFTCYTFDVNGRRFAEHIRDQMQMLDSSRTFGPSPLLQRLTGSGQLWINADGWPQRQELTLHIPQLDDAYDANIHMIVDFVMDNGQLSTTNGQLPMNNSALTTSNWQFTIHNWQFHPFPFFSTLPLFSPYSSSSPAAAPADWLITSLPSV